MSTTRKIVFANEEYYHVFNRGVDRRPTFNNIREFSRAISLIKFYRHKEIPIRYSQLINQPIETRTKIFEQVFGSKRLVDIVCYCLMPNHFHFLLKQLSENGIAKFISNFTNAYTKYFNTKNERVGPLFQGVFKAVHVESDEQLIHLSRYIHLNPVASSVIHELDIEHYQWSSYPEYLNKHDIGITQKELILDMFKSAEDYKNFTLNQIEYAKQLDTIKHLALE